MTHFASQLSSLQVLLAPHGDLRFATGSAGAWRFIHRLKPTNWAGVMGFFEGPGITQESPPGVSCDTSVIGQWIDWLRYFSAAEMGHNEDFTSEGRIFFYCIDIKKPQ